MDFVGNSLLKYYNQFFCKLTCNQEIEVPLESVPVTATVTYDAMREMMLKFDTQQGLYQITKTSHAAGLFDANGNLLAFAEDVGRHNAMDKAIGKLLMLGYGPKTSKGCPFLALLSSRISFEMMQKAVRFGVQVVCGISAATSGAVTLASGYNVTLVGFFARNNSCIVYTHPQRIHTA